MDAEKTADPAPASAPAPAAPADDKGDAAPAAEQPKSSVGTAGADAAGADAAGAASSSSSLPGEAVADGAPADKPRAKKVDSDGDTTEDSDDELDVMEKNARAESCKDAGNVLYKGKDNPGALKKYEEGIEWLAGVSRFALNKLPKASAKLVTGVRLSLRLNAAQAALNLARWADAEAHAGAAVSLAVGEPDLEAKYLKALYRRGLARSRRGDLAAAKGDLLKVAKADNPGNRAARRELKDVKARLKRAKEQRKKQFSGMFGGEGGGLYDDKEEERRQAKLAEERRKHEEKKRWEAENKRREERAEPDISFEDWQKQQKEKRKKEKEAREAADKKRRKLEAEERARARRERGSPRGGDAADITEEDKKIMAEVKAMGYCQHKRTKEERAAFLEAVGDIAPKKIASPAQAEGGGGGAGGGADSGSAGPKKRLGRSSAWNQAGTWEEKDTTAWCKDRLGALVKGVKVESGGGERLLKDDPAKLIEELSAGLGASAGGGAAPGPGDADRLASIMGKLARATARTTEVKELKGDASVAVIRGKARHLFDFSFDLKFSVEVDTSGGLSLADDDKKAKPKKFSGTLKYPDCSATCNGDFESVVAWGKKRPPADLAPRVKEAVDELRAAVHKKIERFVTEYGEEC